MSAGNYLTRSVELAALIAIRDAANAKVQRIHDPFFDEDEQPVTALGRVFATIDAEIARVTAETSEERKDGRS